MTRLIAMGILSDKSADIGNKARVRGHAVHLKERVEFDGKRLFPSHQIDEPLDIMLYVPGILPGISLGIVAPAARCMRQQEGIERGCAISPSSPCHASAWSRDRTSDL